MPFLRAFLTLGLSATLLGACASNAPTALPRNETVIAVTEGGELIKFTAAQPGHIVERKPLIGLPHGQHLVGIDFRVARGVLYTLSSGGRLYTIDTASGQLKVVGSGAPVVLPAGRLGFDFNPAADRIRVVGERGGNLRLNPDTGALAATDPDLYYGLGDAAHGQAPRVGGAGYTYNRQDDKLTTNYAIDLARGTLLTQGTVEGVAPAVSPNSGRLYTVGALGTGAVDDAAFDIADVDNSAFAALRQGGSTRLYTIDLKTGRATLLGTVGDGRALWGLAIAP